MSSGMVETLGEIGGQALKRVTLKNDHAEILLLSYGMITQSWVIPTRDGPLDVVLGYDDPFDYQDNPDFLGTTLGRVANRIAGAKFSLDGVSYPLSENGPGMTLHGGIKGLHKRHWTVERATKEEVEFSYFSPHLEEGFPGNVEFSATIRLDGPCLSYDIKAKTDRPTPINIAQHNYYNLSGGGPIWAHEMQVDAQRYAPLGEDLLPTGEISTIKGTPYDFRQRQSFISADPEKQGLDMAYVLEDDRDPDAPIAKVWAPNGVSLELHSDQPCLQTYNGNNQTVANSGIKKRPFGCCSAICLEPQQYSNAMNIPLFPTIIYTPEKPFSYHARITIAQK